MAKSKAAYWLTKEGLTLLQGWARDGLSEEQIASNMGICRATLENWKNKHLDILDTIKKNKEVADYEVENILFERAKSGEPWAVCFYLKNRRPNKWRDKPDEKQDEKSEPVILIMERSSADNKD